MTLQARCPVCRGFTDVVGAELSPHPVPTRGVIAGGRICRSCYYDVWRVVFV